MQLGKHTRKGAWRLLIAIASLFHLGLATSLHAQPASYFAAVEGLSGDTLESSLRSIIDNHTVLSYTPGIWNAHKDLYEDPEDSSRLILFYSQASWDKSKQDRGSGSEDFWNREHLWPRSYGVSDSSVSNTDLFNLVPANKAVNTDRSNQYFDVTNPADGNYQNPANPLAPDCSEDSNSWEPADGQKGWVARAMFYMATRYTNLQLVDSPPSSPPSTSRSNMAQLSVLLDWNRRFLPSDRERDVNQRIYDDYQGNRNPFIDFPEFADAVFVGSPSWGSWRLRHFSLAELLDPAVSGDAADPDKDGLTNLLELARYSDPRSPDQAEAFEVTVVDDENISISFVRASRTGNLNLDIFLQTSDDLENWGAVPLEEAEIRQVGINQEMVTFTRPRPEAGTFYRLLISRGQANLR